MHMPANLSVCTYCFLFFSLLYFSLFFVYFVLVLFVYIYITLRQHHVLSVSLCFGVRSFKHYFCLLVHFGEQEMVSLSARQNVCCLQKYQSGMAMCFFSAMFRINVYVLGLCVSTAFTVLIY